MIDTHTHLGRLVHDDPGLTASQLLAWMDRHGIEKTIVMAVETPEELEPAMTAALSATGNGGQGAALILSQKFLGAKAF